jgi:hypothetical protein
MLYQGPEGGWLANTIQCLNQATIFYSYKNHVIPRCIWHGYDIEKATDWIKITFEEAVVLEIMNS